MSLINDALKRAKQANHRAANAPFAVTRADMRPAEPPASSGKAPSSWIIVSALFVLGSWFFWQGLKSRSTSPSAPNAASQASTPLPQIPATQPASQPSQPPQSPALPPPKPAAANSDPPKNPNTLLPASKAPPKASPPPPRLVQKEDGGAQPRAAGPKPTPSTPAPSISSAAKPPAPSPAPPPAAAPTTAQTPSPNPDDFKVQGIFYRVTRPSAIVNGITVLMGDEVDGAKVVRINRNSVVLEIGGQKREIPLDLGS